MSNRNYWNNLFLAKKVEKAATAIAGASTKDMFTIASGRIVLLALVAEVTTNIEAQANNLTVQVNPTVGAAGALGTAIETNAAQIGTTFSITGNPADAITKNTGVAIGCVQPCIIPAGVITLTTAADNTGAMKWTAWYYPLDDDAVVTET